MVRITMPGPLSTVWLGDGLCQLEDARISVLDRGFLFGDGVYELIPVYQRMPLRPHAHLRRLARSLGEVGIRDPYSESGWLELVERLVAANDADDVSVYIQVTRGAPHYRDHAFPPDDVRPTVFAMCAPLPALKPELHENGVAAILRADARWERRDIKAISLLANVMQRQDAVEAGAAEVILHDDGIVTEGAASSVFAVIDGIVLTPPDGPEILPGTTRDLILELARDDGIDARFGRITIGQLRAAQEIWLSSSVREVLPVTRLDDKTVGTGRPGPQWRRMHELFQRYKRQMLANRA